METEKIFEKLNIFYAGKSFKIPKKRTAQCSSVLEPDSEDETLGQERVFVTNKKFSSASTTAMKHYINVDKLLPRDIPQLCEDFKNLIVHSSTAQTWGRHSSALSAFTDFCTKYNKNVTLPVSIEMIRAFSTWAISSKKLQASTVRAYVSSISTVQHLNGIEHAEYMTDKCLKLALKGAETLQQANNAPKPVKLAINVHMLHILGHRISTLNWSRHSKQILWTACTISFYTSCRMGELLCEQERNFESKTVLTWENVKPEDNNEWQIYIPFVKTKGFGGKILEIYPIPENSTCPASALKKLWELSEETRLRDPKTPVFKFSSGKCLTCRKMNLILKELLGDFEDEFHKITGHSFRAGIPTALANYPQKSKIADILEWGGWEGKESYKAYTKQNRDKKRAIFNRVLNCL